MDAVFIENGLIFVYEIKLPHGEMSAEIQMDSLLNVSVVKWKELLNAIKNNLNYTLESEYRTYLKIFVDGSKVALMYDKPFISPINGWSCITIPACDCVSAFEKVIERLERLS